ncbi:MAG: DUF1579 domain-containing protein [Planctomycetota bacterium]
MNSSFQIASVIAALGLGVTIGEYRSAQPQPVAPIAQDGAQEGQIPAEMMAEMEAWFRAGTPGEHHKYMDHFAGEWDAEVTLFFGPGVSETSKGTMKNEWVLDGRFLVGQYDGSAMGQPFSGMSVMGYDNAAQTYRGLWIDSMSTHFQQSAGYCSEDGKTFSMKTTTTNAETGEPMPGKEEMVIESADRHRMTAWYEEGGEMVKSMEIVYTRK